jgi:predicted RNase H-like nuclease (RuvC/YqgF family)
MGVPLLVASDVAKAPHLVRTIGARFNVKVFTPSKNLTQEEKTIMAKDIFDPHIRDAYAAALKGYRKYSNRFRRIDSIYPDKAEEYKKMIIEGKAIGKIAKL